MVDCRICGVELSDKNWHKFKQKIGHRVCKKCHNDYKKSLTYGYRIPKRIINLIPCACGCGTLIEEWNKLYGRGKRFVNGHNSRGTHRSEETKNKIRESHKGEKAYQWKGGQKLKDARHSASRRELGYININLPLECTVGHHINLDYIVYIPIWINKIPHNIRTGKNIGYVNALALWWLCYTKEINNCKVMKNG